MTDPRTPPLDPQADPAEVLADPPAYAEPVPAAAERTRFAEPPAAGPTQDDPGPGPLEDDPAESELAADLAALTAAQGTSRDPVEEADSEVAAVPEAPLVAVPSARRGGVLAALIALVVILGGLTGYLGWQARETAGTDPLGASRSEALASAREAARLVFSYDYRTLDKDFAAGKSVTTGEFAKEYARTTSKLVEDVAPRYKAVVSADVSEAAVVRESGNQVVCLVFVNQTSTSSLMKTPKITQSRLEMTLIRTDGRWLVAKIDAL